MIGSRNILFLYLQGPLVMQARYPSVPAATGVAGGTNINPPTRNPNPENPKAPDLFQAEGVLSRRVSCRDLEKQFLLFSGPFGVLYTLSGESRGI